MELHEGRRELLRKHYEAHLGGPERLGQLAYAAARAAGVTTDGSNAMSQGDGAPWVWNLVQEHWPAALEVLDFYHLSEHLHACAQALWGPGSERARAWARQVGEQVLAADATVVFAALSRLRPTTAEGRRAVEQLRGYVQTHQPRMRYGALRQHGYAVASAAVESAMHSVLQRRLKRPGQRWSEPGARQILVYCPIIKLTYNCAVTYPMDMRTAAPILLSPEERSILATWARGRNFPVRLVQRARIIQMAADGVLSQDIARGLGISRPTVQLWRERFLALRLEGLEKDAPRPGRIPSTPDKKVRAVVDATLHAPAPNATHWSVRSMAKAQGISRMAVQRIWKQHNLKPHLIRTFKISRDKHFVEKLYDVVGVYLNPPDKSLVLCVDEKSQIQALDRTQPGLPLKKGRCATLTHDYKRNGTTTLFAALSMLDGKVIGDCMSRHRHQEFIRFLNKIDAETPPELDLHLIVDNYGTHKHPRVKSWLRRHPRFHLHFIPTSSSWLNLVERWFREITDKRIRRGSFRSVPELIAAIKEYLDNHNQNPRIFTWTASVERIMAKVAKCKEALGTPN